MRTTHELTETMRGVLWCQIVMCQVPDYEERLKYAQEAGPLMCDAVLEYERVLDTTCKDCSWLQDYT